MKLFSRIYGIGKPVIIIHGLLGMSDNWNTIGRRLGQKYNIHIIDLRNHGNSPHAEEFNYDVMCSDLVEYIDTYNIQKPTFIGHSLGGKVAMKFAFTYPEKTERLIIVDISPRKYNIESIQNLLQSLYDFPLENLNKKDDVDNILSLTYKEKDIRQFILKNLYRKENKKLGWKFNIKTLLENLNNIQEIEFIKGTCNVPTYFIGGGNSDYITTEDELIIEKHFSNFYIKIITGAGHWVHIEKTEEFYNIVIKSME